MRGPELDGLRVRDVAKRLGTTPKVVSALFEQDILPTRTAENPVNRCPVTVTSEKSVEDFVASLIPSLVSIDVDGRVMRMDSFSKVLVPGSRHGWITASAQIVERYQRHAEVASQGPNGFSQLILYKLLDETWGHEGYLRWLMNMRVQYTKKRDSLLAACEQHLARDLVSWTPPAAGMFVSPRSPQPLD